MKPAVLISLLGFCFSSETFSQGTAFTYQGRLNENALPANGAYDLQFTAYDALATGNAVGGPLSVAPVTASNGLFTVTLDLGPGVFSGPPRWLEIGVRTNGSAGAYILLAPRQALTSTPYAITAGNVTGPIDGGAIISGTISSAQLASGAAAANLGASGQSGVASGGIILSSNANAADLINAGYVKIGQAELGDFWKSGGLRNAPASRINHAALWTGTEMIVWGGFGTTYLNTGGRYNPALNSWTATSLASAPSPRTVPTAVWTGNEMIVWGGQDGGATLNTGGRYNLATDTWTATTTNNAPSPRVSHSAIWTGNRMVIWGGAFGGEWLDTGGRYDPALNSWTATATNNAPKARSNHSAVWTGNEMIVWAGTDGLFSSVVNSGGRYNPTTDSWTAIATNGAPIARYRHSAVWTGTGMIVWGGSTGGLFTEQNTGGQYNPSLNSWTATSTSGAPAARASHSAVWSGNEMIVWGGSAGGSLDTGARYNPSNNTWVNVTTTGAPTPRTGHTAIWTGNRMIVWGGASSFGNTNTGGRYDPTADSWQPTATTSPSPRQYHRAIWTGNEMIVWGGTPAIDYSQSVATGARYSPAVDSWMPTSMNNAPSPRSEHSSIWTGSEMIIWGGANSGPGLADGRRYNPLTDTWTTISGANAPSGRQSHTAVWTGH